jgi:hypothetical protein
VVAAAIQFVIKVGQASSHRACPCQRVGLNDRKLARSVRARRRSSAACSRVLCCATAVVGGQLALLGGLRAMPSGTLALSSCTDDDLGAGDSARAVLLLRRGVALAHLQITRRGSKVSRQRREIAGARNLVTLASGVQTRSGAPPAPS